MSKILYKAKHVHALSRNRHLDGRWIEGYLSDENCINSTELEGEFLVDPKTVCMGTEYIKDGMRVFECDIVKCDDYIGVVRFGKYRNPSSGLETEHYGFYIEWKLAETSDLRKDIGFWMNERDVKVVGNVYDNHDLLTSSTDSD